MSLQPNVILVVLDTVRRDHVYGYDRETMPTLGAFARDTTAFTDAVSPAAWSVPAHASLFTGTYPETHGATALHPVFRDGPTLPAVLRKAGYETVAVSNNRYIRPLTGFARGFDEFVMPARATVPQSLATPLGPVIDRVMGSPARYRPELLLNAVRGRRCVTSSVPSPSRHGLVDRVGTLVSAASTPFFLFVNLSGAHLPRSPAPEHVDRFVDDTLADAPVVTDERAQKFGPGVGERGLERLRQLYDADLRTVDDQLAALLGRLSAAGLLEGSLVVLVSDHGEHLGEFGLVGHQHSVFDGVVSVPLVVQFPGGGPDRVDSQVETRRIFHTVLDETGVVSYPERSLGSGRGDDIARGAFYSPMLDIPALVWDDKVRYDRQLLGEPLLFARTGEHKLVSFDGEEWLFRLPESGSEPLSRADGRRVRERLS